MRRLTKISLYRDSFGKEPTEQYISNFKPDIDYGDYTISNASYQRIDAPIRFAMKNSTLRPSFNEINNCRYLAFKNDNEITYYGFITKCEYKSEGVVYIYFKIDPFTTYLDGEINETAFIERQTGDSTIKDPDLNFSANQVIKKVDYYPLDNVKEVKDVILLYVKNTSSGNSETDYNRRLLDAETGEYDGNSDDGDNIREGTFVDDVDENGNYIPSVDRNYANDLVSYYKSANRDYGNNINSNFNELKEYGDVHGHNYGYDIYAIVGMTDNDNVFQDVINNPIFYGGNGCNIIGAEYRHVLKPFNAELIDGSDNLYKLSTNNRIEMSQPFDVGLPEFNFPNNVPDSIKQAPYYKRLFVSNDGNTVMEFNPKASPSDPNGSESLLRKVTVHESPEMGSPIVYEFDSTESNGGHQFWSDSTDRSIPVFANYALEYYIKNKQKYVSELYKDLDLFDLKFRKIRASNIVSEKYTDFDYSEYRSAKLGAQIKAQRKNINNTTDVNRSNLADSQSASKYALNQTYATAKQNLRNSNDTAVSNLKRTNDASIYSLTKEQHAATTNLSRSNSTAVSNLNRTLSASRKVLDRNNKNINSSLDTSYHISAATNEYNHDKEIDIIDTDRRFDMYRTHDAVNKINKDVSLSARLASYAINTRQNAAKDSLITALGLGAAGAGLEGVAKGFAQLIPALVGGAVSATATLSALEIRQKADRKIHNEEWASPPGYIALNEAESPDLFDINYSSEWRQDDSTGVGINQSNDKYWAEPVGAIDEGFSKTGTNIKKAQLQASIEIANHIYKYGGAHGRFRGNLKDNSDTTLEYANKINSNSYEYNRELNHLKISRSVSNFNDTSGASRTNLKTSNNTSSANLSNSQKASSSALNKKVASSTSNLSASNATSIKNLTADYETRIKVNNNNLSVAFNNMLRDIKQQKNNLENTIDAQSTSLEEDREMALKDINRDLALGIISEYYDMLYVLESKYSGYNDFWNNIITNCNRSSISVNSGKFWGIYSAKLNRFSVYDIGISARELRYCINYIKRYGNYCGIVKYSIKLSDNTYIRTRDYQMTVSNIPMWASQEISEKLNQGVYIRET